MVFLTHLRVIMRYAIKEHAHAKTVIHEEGAKKAAQRNTDRRPEKGRRMRRIPN